MCRLVDERMAHAGDSTVVCASVQTAGRGRGGNAWLSPRGCAMFSCGVQLPIASRLARAPGYVQHLLAMAMCAAVCEQEGYQDTGLRIKWPNDIYFGRSHKIGGVLVECSVYREHMQFIVGAGLNVANERPTVCINDILADECAPFSVPQVVRHFFFLVTFSIIQIIALTLNNFETFIGEFQEHGAQHILPTYYSYWLHRCVYI
jgi:biotin--protein ligase